MQLFKFTERNLQMMEWERYGEENLKRVREVLQDTHLGIFQKRFGHILDDSEKIKKEYLNRPITKSIGDQIRRAMFASGGDKLLLDDGQINNALKDELENKGVRVDTMLKGIGKQGVSTISSNALEDRYSLMTGVFAKNWNTGHSGYSLSDMTDKANFEVKTLDKLVTSSGANEDIADSLYGKKLLIDP